MALLTALLAATLPLLTGGTAQLLPVGEFAARDGRPGPGKTWRVDDTAGQAIAAKLNATASATPLVIDYEHQTFNAAQNGKPAPAAGWITSAQWEPGKGLVAKVEWTAAAKAQIDAGEYRYLSPVITFDEERGTVTGVLAAALTNYPALLGMDAVAAQLRALNGSPAGGAALSTPALEQEQSDMALLTALLTALGLAATTTEADALAAVTALKATADTAKARPPVPTALTAALGLADGADETAALSAVGALKSPSAATAQLVATLQGQVATLTAKMAEGEVTSLVDNAIADHKLLPAQRDNYLELGRKDLALLKSVLEKAVPIAGLAGQTGGKPPAGDAGAADGVAALSAAQRSVCTMLGVDPAVYAKQLKAAA